MQETTVEDGVKFRFTDEQGVGCAPAMQGRTLAVGANRQDRRRGLFQRGALDKRAVDAQPGIAGEDKVGLFIFTQAGHRCGADPQLRGVNIGPGGGAGGLRRICSIKATPPRGGIATTGRPAISRIVRPTNTASKVAIVLPFSDAFGAGAPARKKGRGPPPESRRPARPSPDN
ncbi:Uncharacterised protein [Klebsiella variicola]|nr:Uncharacterised protein [Klebsiella variicola]